MLPIGRDVAAPASGAPSCGVTGASRNYPSLVRRPPPPGFLRRFVIDLYGGRCLRCGVDRPLAVAHLAPWPAVRDSAMQQPGPDQEGTATLRFHQPENVVLLCCNCHALFDNPNVVEVYQTLMFYLRNRAMAVRHFGQVVRAFVCRRWAEAGDDGRLTTPR
jgi:hypothetical protein